ncbi:hypothetical protein Barb6_03143 [Bacteroidales bacterium Barb6]|nr:hypothetical protein Barb6_03143 [Bacteroidales bacterium Barb6]
MWGLRKGIGKGVLARTTEYILHCKPSFAIYIVLAGLHWVVLSVTRRAASLYVGLKSGVLAGRYRVAFSTNPTFRFAACGAEIRYPFRIHLTVSFLIINIPIFTPHNNKKLQLCLNHCQNCMSISFFM